MVSCVPLVKTDVFTAPAAPSSFAKYPFFTAIRAGACVMFAR